MVFVFLPIMMENCYNLPTLILWDVLIYNKQPLEQSTNLKQLLFTTKDIYKILCPYHPPKPNIKYFMKLLVILCTYNGLELCNLNNPTLTYSCNMNCYSNWSILELCIRDERTKRIKFHHHFN
jgi:hypothetical protein